MPATPTLNPDWTHVAAMTDHPEVDITKTRHHPDGCKGRRTTPKSRGWFTRPGSPSELARATNPCLTCLAMIGHDPLLYQPA